MNRKVLFAALFVGTITLTGCVGGGDKPLTEAEQAAKHNMTPEEYQETKEAAARMNMGVEEHMDMGH